MDREPSPPRVVIVTLGTRGDVEPYLALGRALQDRGAEAVISASTEFKDLVGSQGLGFMASDIPVAEVMRATVDEADPTLGTVRQLREAAAFYTRTADAQLDAVEAAAAAADHVVAAGLYSVLGAWMARLHGKQATMSFLQPNLPTREMPAWAFSRRNLGPANAMSWKLYYRTAMYVGRGLRRRLVERYGADAGHDRASTMAMLNDPEVPKLGAWSRTILPQPDDYPRHASQVGFMSIPPGDELSASVQDFLAAGDPPVFASMGSMMHVDPREFARSAIAAARANGQRLILARGWLGLEEADLGDTGDDVLLVGSEPHRDLFSRCRALIHHAGAGTTQTAASSGVPQVPVPMLVDQPLWAGAVHSLGVAGRPVPVKRLDAERLTASLTQALQPRVADRARDVAARMRQEPDAAATAAELIMRRLQE